MRTAVICIAKDQGGAMAITIGLMMTAFAGLVGLSVDLSDWYGTRRAMQSAADAAALGGARELLNGGTSAQVTTAATTDGNLNANGLASRGMFNIQPNMAAQTVTVTMTKSADMFLSALFLGSTPTITVTAEAGVVSSGPGYCLLLTNPNGAGAITLSGSSSIQASGCPIIVNSTSANAIQLSGSTKITGKSVCGPGGHSVQGSSSISPAETTCAAATDKLASITPPSNVNDACQYTNTSINNGSGAYIDGNGATQPIKAVNGVITLSPGVYCGSGSQPAIGLDNNSGASTVTFSPGVYILRNGGITTGNQTTMSGSGVGFWLTGTGGVNISGSSGSTAVNITAPTSGPMAGIAIYQDQSEPAGTITEQLAGNSTITFTGLLYFGNQNVTVNGSSEDQGAAFTSMVAYNLTYNGYSTLYLNSNYSSTNVPNVTASSSSVALLQ